MKFRRRTPTTLLLFLLPSLAYALVGSAPEEKAELSSTTSIAFDSAGLTPAVGVATNPKVRADVGTKDAPVDGLDGKPHSGPWVESGTTEKSDKKKDSAKGAKADDDALKKTQTLKKPAPRPIGEAAIPEVNDGVMNDPHRPAPKKGTTGTEGGVTEKNRVQKAQEGQTGEKAEKKPDQPKEQPPLAHGEEKNEEMSTAKEGEKKAGTTQSGKERTKLSVAAKEKELKNKEQGEIGGLAVSLFLLCHCYNPIFGRRTHQRRELVETDESSRENPRHSSTSAAQGRCACTRR